VVRDATLHERVCTDIDRWLEDDQRWHVLGVTESPITGPKGNREFLIAARRGAQIPPSREGILRAP